MVSHPLNGLHTPLAIAEADDEPEIRTKYRPFLLPPTVSQNDWVAQLELSGVEALVRESTSMASADRLRVLVLYGSLRSRLVGVSPSPQRRYHDGWR